MADNKIGGSTTPRAPTTTTKTAETTETKTAKKPEVEEHPDAVGIGDVAGDVALTVLEKAFDPLGMLGRSKKVIDGAVDIATGKSSAVEQLKNVRDLADLHATVDKMKPGGELEIGRKLELELSGEEGETSVDVGMKKNDDGSYDVTFKQSSSVGAKLGEPKEGGHGPEVEVSGSAGYGTSVTFHAKNAEEAKRILDKGLYVMSMGPGVDTLAMIGAAVSESSKVTGGSIAVESGVAAEVGFKLPGKNELEQAGVKVDGEVVGSYGITVEAGPPAATYVDVTIEGEGGVGLEGSATSKTGTSEFAAGADGAKASITLRYAIEGQPGDDEKMKDPAGKKEIVERAQRSKNVSVVVEGEVQTKSYVVTTEKKGKGTSASEALDAAIRSESEVDVDRVVKHNKIGGGINVDGKSGAAIELAWRVTEPAKPEEKKKVLEG